MAKPKLKFSVKNTESVEKEIQRAAKRLNHKQVEPLVRQGAEVMADEARSRAPRDSGLLRDSIHTKRQVGDDPPVWLAAVERSPIGGAPHAHLLEHGTVNMQPQPFWRPAFDAVHDDIVRILKSGLQKKVGGE